MGQNFMDKPNSDSKHHAELIVNEHGKIAWTMDTDFILDLWNELNGVISHRG